MGKQAQIFRKVRIPKIMAPQPVAGDGGVLESTENRFIAQIESVRAIDADKRTVEVSFSSEEPVERGFGKEILGHKRGEVDLAFLKSGHAPLLVNHSGRDHIGVVEKASIGADRKGRATVRFGESERSEEVFQDVINKIRSNISVGYEIQDVRLEESKDGRDLFRVTKWKPFEVSIVAMPADESVGVGRASPNDDDFIEIEIGQRSQPTMTGTPEEVAAAAATAAAAAAAATAPAVLMSDEAVQAAARTLLAESEKNEGVRVGTIFDLGARHKMTAEIIQKAIRERQSIVDFHTIVLAEQERRLNVRQDPQTDLGLNAGERKQYSLSRAILSRCDEHVDAGFERECSKTIAVRLGENPRGIYIPWDMMAPLKRGTRELTAGTDTAGGHLVATEHLGDEFIELLRDQMIATQSGARFMTGLVGDLDIPKLTTGGTLEWLAESGALTGGDQVFGNVTLTPKTAGAKTQMSRKLLQQSSPDVENVVREDLRLVVQTGIDSAVWNGSGAGNQPTGIRNQAGVASVSMGSPDGGPLTWAKLVEFETVVANLNALLGTLSYVTNSKTRGKLKTTAKDTGSGLFLWAEGSTPLNGYGALVSNSIPSNLVEGSSGATLSSMIFGNWRDVFIGQWGVLDIQADPFTAGDSGAIIIRMFQSVDIAVRHAQSFAVADDIVTV